MRKEYLIPELCLLITDAKFDDMTNEIKSGRVVNGNWNYEVRNGEGLAKSGNYIVNRWKHEKTTWLDVTKYSDEDYNEAIERGYAEQKEKNEKSKDTTID